LVDGRSGDASLAQVRLQALSVECSFCDSSWGGERAVSPRAFVHHPFLVSNLNLGMYRHSTILSYGHDRGLPRLRLRLIWSCSVAIGSAFALPARQRHLIHEADLNNLMAGNLSCIMWCGSFRPSFHRFSRTSRVVSSLCPPTAVSQCGLDTWLKLPLPWEHFPGFCIGSRDEMMRLDPHPLALPSAL
jgi:hypothetical protein